MPGRFATFGAKNSVGMMQLSYLPDAASEVLWQILGSIFGIRNRPGGLNLMLAPPGSHEVPTNTAVPQQSNWQRTSDSMILSSPLTVLTAIRVHQ